MPCRISPNNSIQVQSNPMENHSTGILINVMEIPRAKMTLMARTYQENDFIHFRSRSSNIRSQFWGNEILLIENEAVWPIFLAPIMSFYTEIQHVFFLSYQCRMEECYLNLSRSTEFYLLNPWDFILVPAQIKSFLQCFCFLIRPHWI